MLRMIFIQLLVLCIGAAVAQLNVTNHTTLNDLTVALTGLGLPNATNFLTSAEIQTANLAANETTSAGCLLACKLLRDVLNLNNSLPDNYNPTYWADQQQEIEPSCFVTPGTATYVAGALLVLEYFHCPFAIKSIGSSPSGSNIASPGIVIDLRTFRTIALSRERDIVTIGPGQNWGTVIDGLGILGYMVPAAYSTNVGVGGYILNGGMSYASSRYGLAADNIARYEVVTANGSIVHASPDEHRDLYWALRGAGGQYFGIVTRFDVWTFPVPRHFFGGFYSTGLDYSQPVFEAFEDFVQNWQTNDSAAQFICSVSPSGTHAILSHLEGVEAPSAFQGIYAIPATSSTLKVRTMSDLAREIAAVSPRGHRELFKTFTVKADAVWMQDCSQAFLDEVAKLRDTLQDRMLDPGLSFSPVSPGILNQAKKKGGNPMSLERLDNGSYLIAYLGFGWMDSKDDEAVRATAEVIHHHCIPMADNNRFSGYLYPGYSNFSEQIWDSFGTPNALRLQSIATVYDPAKWLRRLQNSGPFKLSEAL